MRENLSVPFGPPVSPPVSTGFAPSDGRCCPAEPPPATPRYTSTVPLAKRRPRNPSTLAANVPTGVVQLVGTHRRFFLSEPIDLNVHQEAGRWVIEYSPLQIFVAEPSRDAAYAGFVDMFDLLWEQYAEAPDRELTKGARALKHALLHTVEEVEPLAS